MTKLKTKDVEIEPTYGNGDYVKPVLTPGTYKVKLNSCFLKKEADPKFGDKLVLHLETEPVEGTFKGLQKDRADASKGNYAGQVGMVSYSRYGRRDETTPSGFQVLRDEELFKDLGLLCKALELQQWWNDADNKYENVDELIAAFDKERPYEGVWFYATLAGREYVNGQYTNFDLFLPKWDRTLGGPISLKKEKVQKFFESTHIERLKPKDSTAKAPTTEYKVEAKDVAVPFVETKASTDKSTDPSKPVDLRSQTNDQRTLEFLNDGPTTKGAAQEKTKDEIKKDNMDFLAEVQAEADAQLKGNTATPPADISSGPEERAPWES